MASLPIALLAFMSEDEDVLGVLESYFAFLCGQKHPLGPIILAGFLCMLLHYCTFVIYTSENLPEIFLYQFYLLRQDLTLKRGHIFQDIPTYQQ